jgi:hypothetical protein
MRWLAVIALAACGAPYESPCALGADEVVFTPAGAATAMRRSPTGVVVTSQSATTTTNPQRTVTITQLAATGVMGATATFDTGSVSIDAPSDVESTGDGLAIVRALEVPSPDFGSLARSLELEIAGPTGSLLPPRTLPFADCTDCPPRAPVLRFFGGHLVLLYSGASTTSTIFAILGLDGSVLASGPLVGLVPGAPGRFKSDIHADALVLEVPGALEIVDGSLNVLATIPAPPGSAIDFDLARGVAQLGWIDTESTLTSSLLTEQIAFDGTILQAPRRISQALAVTMLAADDSLAVLGFEDDNHYLAAAAAGTKLGGDLVAAPGTPELAIPDATGFAYFTNERATVHRHELGCAP